MYTQCIYYNNNNYGTQYYYNYMVVAIDLLLRKIILIRPHIEIMHSNMIMFCLI